MHFSARARWSRGLRPSARRRALLARRSHEGRRGCHMAGPAALVGRRSSFGRPRGGDLCHREQPCQIIVGVLSDSVRKKCYLPAVLFAIVLLWTSSSAAGPPSNICASLPSSECLRHGYRLTRRLCFRAIKTGARPGLTNRCAPHLNVQSTYSLARRRSGFAGRGSVRTDLPAQMPAC